MDLIDMSREAAYRSLATDPSSVFLTIDEAQRDPYDATASNLDYLDEFDDLERRLEKRGSTYASLLTQGKDEEAAELKANLVDSLNKRYERRFGDEWIVDAPYNTYTKAEIEAAEKRLAAKPNGSSTIPSSKPEAKIKEKLTNMVATDQGSSLISAPLEDKDGDTISLSFGMDGKPIRASRIGKDKTVTPFTMPEGKTIDDFVNQLVDAGVFTQSDIERMASESRAGSFDPSASGEVETFDALGEAPEVEAPEVDKTETPKPEGKGKPTPFQILVPKIKKFFGGLPAFKQKRLRRELKERLELSEARAESFDPSAEEPLVKRPKASVIPAAEASQRPDEDVTQDATKVEIERIMDFLEEKEEMDASLLSTDTEGLFKFLDALKEEDLPEDLANDIQDYINKSEAEEQSDDVGDPLVAPGIRTALEEPTADSVNVPDVKTEDMEMEDYLSKGGEDALRFFFDDYAVKEGYYSDKTRLITEWKRYAAKNSIARPVIKMIVEQIQREMRE
tara:strand:- start:267 stop:1787 length:1521 start_codon:yes stop_codon:yes gene_type:complete